MSKTIRNTLALVLSVVMLLSVLVVTGSAAPVTGSFDMLNYNVAGLPDLNALFGKEGARDVPANQVAIGTILNDSDAEIIAVQEDFQYHESLVSNIKNYDYQTIHSGGVPVGDGMNIFSKLPIYNVTRTTWDMADGVFYDGCDELTPKGILYFVAEIGNGVYVDVYDIHADANGSAMSIKSRNDNLNQLAEMINSRTVDRPVIVTGDFNSMFHIYESNLKESLIDGCGLKDAWAELCNNGDYENFDSYIDQYGPSFESAWGVWDSVERYLYKDGGGVELTASNFGYVSYTSEEGVSLSDHSAAKITFTYTLKGDFVENTETLAEEEDKPVTLFFRQIRFFIKAWVKLLLDIPTLFESK